MNCKYLQVPLGKEVLLSQHPSLLINGVPMVDRRKIECVAENTFSGPGVSDSQILIPGSKDEREDWRVLM